MKQKRDNIFIWPTWIAKLVAGEEQCEWKYWLKAHYLLDKKPSDFNLAKWTVEHNQLLRQRRDALERLGFKVSIEDQNAFKLVIRTGEYWIPENWKSDKLIDTINQDITISGKADIIAVNLEEKESIYLIEDCKTGQPKTSDHIQVILYMMFIPKAIDKYKDMEFNGCIVYKLGLHNIDIPAEAAQDESLKRIIWDTIKRIAGNESECRKIPSYRECKNCDINCEDCNERIG